MVDKGCTPHWYEIRGRRAKTAINKSGGSSHAALRKTINKFGSSGVAIHMLHLAR
jgi:hypothetical protein